MLYSNIKKFTSIGSYCIDIDLDYFADKFDDFIKKYNLQICPDFQRGHIWNEAQQIAYIEYMIKGGNFSNVFLLNHPGWMGSFKGDFVLVDGLQRYTAIRKFLSDKLPVFNGNYLYDFEDCDKMLSQIKFKYAVNNLKTRKEVLNWYIELNSGGTVHTSEEIERVKTLLAKEEN